MKNLLVITLLFLVGCSQNFKYVLDCEMSKVTRTDVVKTEYKTTIKFNDTKVGSTVFYNLLKLKIVEVPDDTDVFYPYLYAERIFNNGTNRHYLQLHRSALSMSTQYSYLNKNDEWTQTMNQTSFCKLR